MSRAVWEHRQSDADLEYAVLEGEPAVVCGQRLCQSGAVGWRAVVTFIEAAIRKPGWKSPSWVVRLDGPSVPQVDTSSFVQGGRKLGVGSSARRRWRRWALFDAAGFDLSDEQIRGRAYAAAKRAHDAAQGSAGSGADLWAAVHGAAGAGAYDTSVEGSHCLCGCALWRRRRAYRREKLLARYREVHKAAQPAIAKLGIAARGFLIGVATRRCGGALGRSRGEPTAATPIG